MTIVNAVAIRPRSGEVWDELQGQLKKAIEIVKKHGGENVTLLVTVIGGQPDERSDHARHRRELDPVRPDPGGGIRRSRDAGAHGRVGEDRHLGDLHRADARTLIPEPKRCPTCCGRRSWLWVGKAVIHDGSARRLARRRARPPRPCNR